MIGSYKKFELWVPLIWRNLSWTRMINQAGVWDIISLIFAIYAKCRPHRSMDLFCLPRWTALQLGAHMAGNAQEETPTLKMYLLGNTSHMATCLDFPIIPPQSFFVVFVLFVVVFVMRTCRNRFIHFHAEEILFPVLTAHLYFLFLPRPFPLERTWSSYCD
jgi:hypothetical protein